jgi:hypothetical protein
MNFYINFFYQNTKKIDQIIHIYKNILVSNSTMLFCEKCRYAYNVTKDVNNKQIGGKVNNALNSLFEKFSANEEIRESDIKRLKAKDIMDDERYDTMNKKNQKRFVSNIKAIDKNFFVQDEEGEDASSGAYLICRFCKNSKPIEPKTFIYSKTYGSATVLEIEDYSQMIWDYSLPRTRNYICKNSKCPTHKDPDLKEAVITKNKAERAVYICTECKTHWVSSV